MRWLLTDAGWSAEEVADSCTVHGESDGDAPGFYWAADDNRDPYWWSGYGFRMAGTFATLGANGPPAHPPASCHVSPPPDSCADEAAARGVGESGACGRRRLGVARHRHAGRPTSCGG